MGKQQTGKSAVYFIPKVLDGRFAFYIIIQLMNNSTYSTPMYTCAFITPGWREALYCTNTLLAKKKAKRFSTFLHMRTPPFEGTIYYSS